MVGFAVHRQFKKVWTLKTIGNRVIFILPIQQIRRGKNMVLTIAIHNHDPVLCRSVPEHLWIAFRVDKQRVMLVMLPGAPVIETVGKTLAFLIES